jgi:hypothetical protein
MGSDYSILDHTPYNARTECCEASTRLFGDYSSEEKKHSIVKMFGT